MNEDTAAAKSERTYRPFFDSDTRKGIKSSLALGIKIAAVTSPFLIASAVIGVVASYLRKKGS